MSRLAPALLALLLSLPAAQAAAPAPRAQFDDRAAQVSALRDALDRMVKADKNAGAYKAVLAGIDERSREAGQLAGQENWTGARALQDEAYASAQAAIRALKTGSTGAQPAATERADKAQVDRKARADFAARADSTGALREALTRIAAEKHQESQVAPTLARIDNRLSEARALLAADPAQARAVLDDAYASAKVSIESLRRGETLVRELKFDSKADEYRYEVDRHETYIMLVKLLTDARPGADFANAFLERARLLRGQATEAAGREAWDGAILLLEDATRELVKAIRSAGVFIPS